MSTSWICVLPKVFELLLENPEAIVDDTSVEKVLHWLRKICQDDGELAKLMQADTGTFKFLQDERVFASSTSLAFALRLVGIICSRKEVYIGLDSEVKGGFVKYLLQQARSNDCTWQHAGVRDAWLKAWKSIIDHQYGLGLIKTLGHTNVVIEALNDQSIFVASSAQKCLAKYIIKTNEQRWCNDVKVVLDQLCKMVECGNTMAVIDVIHNVLSFDHVNGQEALGKRPLLDHCLQLVKTSDLSVCWKVVELITEMSQNTRKWNLDWEVLLTSCDTQDSQTVSSRTPSEILLELPIILFKRGFVPCALCLLPGLGGTCADQHTGLFPRSWLDVLCQLTDLPLKVVLDRFQDNIKSISQKDNLPLQNGENSTDPTLLAKEILSQADSEHSLHKVGEFIKQWTEQKNFSTDVALHTLVAMQDLVEQCFESAKGSSVQQWMVLTLDILESSLSTECERDMFPSAWCGNQKMIKVCMDTLAKFAESQLFKGPSANCGVSSSLKEHFLKTVKLMLLVIERSNTSDTLIGCALKTLAVLLKHSSVDWIADLFRMNDVGEPKKKRCKPDIEEDELRAKFAFVIHRRMRDNRWEVRDSMLEFISSGILQGYTQDLLEQHKIHLLVWKAVSDSESFVRASALRLLGYMVCDSHMWKALLQQAFSQVDVLNAVCGVLSDDPEAFPRRRALENLVLWVKNKHPIIEKLISCKDSKEEQDTVEGSLLKQTEETGSSQKYSNAISTICRASQDFDWEVKLLALDFWNAVVEYLGLPVNVGRLSSNPWEPSQTVASDHLSPSFFEKDVKPTGSLSALKETKCLNDELERTAGVPESTGLSCCDIDHKHLNECIKTLSNVGAARVILDAVGDCDHMVCEKALSLLIPLRCQWVRFGSLVGECTIRTSEDLRARLDKNGKKVTVSEFGEILNETDFKAILESILPLDSSVRSDPVSFLEDILAAATEHKENLLDCY